MLDRFVFWSDHFAFPDQDAGSTLAYGTNSIGQKLRICFKLVEPPRVSRLHLQIMEEEEEPLSDLHSFDVVASYRDVLLLAMGCHISMPGYHNNYPMIDYFIYRTGAGCGGCSRPSLTLLPPLGGTIAEVRDRIEAKTNGLTNQRLRRMQCLDLGVLCRGGEGEFEFAVAELEITGSKAPPKLHVLLSSPKSTRRWEVKHPPIVPLHCNCGRGFSLEELLFYFDAGTVIPFKNYLCWVDYCFGILFCDVFDESPKLEYLQFPSQLPKFARGSETRTWIPAYHAVGVTKGDIMKFVTVVCGKGWFPETIEPDTPDFTVTSWSLRITERENTMEWEQDAILRSSELWDLDGFAHLPRTPLQFPVISMDEPNVVYFMLEREGHGMHKKVWLVAIDMSNTTLKSSSLYMSFVEQVGDLSGDEAKYFAEQKLRFYDTFLPSEFSRYLNPLGTR